MVTFNWEISAVERAIDLDGLADVIQKVHWKYIGTDQNRITAEIQGIIQLKEPDKGNFKPFEEITSSDVVGWLENMIGISYMQENLEDQIALIVKPTTIISPLYNKLE